MKKLFRVVAKTSEVIVPNKDGGQTSKYTLVLQETGGKYEPSYVATVFNHEPRCHLETGDLVYAILRFQAHEYNGQWYQDIVVKELIPINTNN